MPPIPGRVTLGGTRPPSLNGTPLPAKPSIEDGEEAPGSASIPTRHVSLPTPSISSQGKGLAGRLQGPRWVEGEAVIQVTRGVGTVPTTVPALLYGPLALHPTIESSRQGHWAVSHRGTGLRIATLTAKNGAVLLTETLVRLGGKGWEEDCWEDMVCLLPRWIRPWVRACRIADRYLDPTPYVNGKDKEPDDASHTT